MGFSHTELLNELRRMDEYKFEELVADVWSERGWKTKVTSGSNDRGIDIIAEKHNPFYQKQLIQAKRHSSNNKIGSPDIQQYSSLYQQEKRVDSVIIITTSSFSQQAKKTADDLNIKLVNHNDLSEIIFNIQGYESILSTYDISKSNRSENANFRQDNPNNSIQSAEILGGDIVTQQEHIVDTKRLQDYKQGGTTFSKVGTYIGQKEKVLQKITGKEKKISVGSKSAYDKIESETGEMENLQPTYIFTNKNIISIMPNKKIEEDEIKKISYDEISDIESHQGSRFRSAQSIKINADKIYHLWVHDVDEDDINSVMQIVKTNGEYTDGETSNYTVESVNATKEDKGSTDNKSSEYTDGETPNYTVESANTAKENKESTENKSSTYIEGNYTVETANNPDTIECIAASRRNVVNTTQIEDYTNGGSTFNKISSYLETNELVIQIFTAKKRKITINKQAYDKIESTTGEMGSLHPTYVFTSRRIISIMPNIDDRCDEVIKINYKQISNINIHQSGLLSSAQRIEIDADKTYDLWMSNENEDNMKFVKKKIREIRAGHSVFE